MMRRVCPEAAPVGSKHHNSEIGMPSMGRVLFVSLCVVLLTIGLAAQRGGRGTGVERPDTPTQYDNAENGLKFAVPQGARLYTPEAPGPFRAMMTAGHFMYLVSGEYRNATVTAKYSPNATEADMRGYRDIIEANPPQAKLPGYKKRSIRAIKVGKAADKDAVEFVYNAEHDNLPKTFRLVVFVHNGKGFTFSCSSLEALFGTADSAMFTPLFANLEFR
jgi:hypothetical protein